MKKRGTTHPRVINDGNLVYVPIARKLFFELPFDTANAKTKDT